MPADPKDMNQNETDAPKKHNPINFSTTVTGTALLALAILLIGEYLGIVVKDKVRKADELRSNQMAS